MTSKWLNWLPTSQPGPSQPPSFHLPGHAVEFDCDGARHLLVADESDAALAVERLGAPRGEVWTLQELSLLAAAPDASTRSEVVLWKRTFNGTLRQEFVRNVHSRKKEQSR